MRFPLAASLVILSAFGSATPSFAHAHLKGSSPTAGGIVTTPPSGITLHFTEGVEPRFCKVVLSTAAGDSLKLERPSMAPGDTKTLVSKVPETLPAGTYRVTWHAVSVDTHKTEGSFTFTVAR